MTDMELISLIRERLVYAIDRAETMPISYQGAYLKGANDQILYNIVRHMEKSTCCTNKPRINFEDGFEE